MKIWSWTYRFWNQAQVDNLIASIQANGMKADADVVYNHRDGKMQRQTLLFKGG